MQITVDPDRTRTTPGTHEDLHILGRATVHLPMSTSVSGSATHFRVTIEVEVTVGGLRH